VKKGGFIAGAKGILVPFLNPGIFSFRHLFGTWHRFRPWYHWCQGPLVPGTRYRLVLSRPNI